MALHICLLDRSAIYRFSNTSNKEFLKKVMSTLKLTNKKTIKFPGAGDSCYSNTRTLGRPRKHQTGQKYFCKVYRKHKKKLKYIYRFYLRWLFLVYIGICSSQVESLCHIGVSLALFVWKKTVVKSKLRNEQ